MQNLFYVPPHQPRDIHPKPIGVRTVVKRNQPTRLDLSAPAPGLLVDMGLLTQGDLYPDQHLGPRVEPAARRTLRHRLGNILITWGKALQGQTPSPIGQPA